MANDHQTGELTSWLDSGPATGYEQESGIKWNRLGLASCLLRRAGFEAQHPNPDVALTRSLFISNLLFQLEALPQDVTEEEIALIQARLKRQSQSLSDEAQPGSSSAKEVSKWKQIELNLPNINFTYYNNGNGASLGGGERQNQAPQGLENQPSQPLLQRLIASTIVYFCLAIRLLLPYVYMVLDAVQRSELARDWVQWILRVSLVWLSWIQKGGIWLASVLVRIGEQHGLGGGLLKAVVCTAAAVLGGVSEGGARGVEILSSP
ncbi:hypothetical protein FQN57_002604 [Myotisia sp. PD_48]|nr:hypothetical protein FQN57_002604 [Myotisia sp. PD_48]